MDGTIVAVKKVRFSYDSGAECGSRAAGLFGVPASALREVAALKSLAGHPNIVTLRDVFVEAQGRIFIVSEHVRCGLRRHLDRTGPLHVRRAKLCAWQLMRALAHCHSHCVAHRDVKPQNVPVDPSADHLKLCDFSLSHRLVVPVDAQTRRVASLWYRSPEILLGGPPSAFALDMWSVGCLNAEMLAHCPLFPGGSEIETLFLQFGRLGTPTEETWPGVSSLPYWSDKFPMFPARPNLSSVAGGDASTAHFLAQLLCCDPAKRIGADASLGHKYFGDLDRTGHGADYASRYRKDGARAGSPEESLCAPLPDTVIEAEDMLRKKRARH